MEGVTGSVFRRLHKKYFDGIDAYYTPFLAVNQTHKFKRREKREFLPEENPVLPIPQILTNHSADFLWATEELKRYGYREVNLNMGCPASTVFTKAKGAGMLSDPERLNLFLKQVFEGAPDDTRITIKTRIGVKSTDELDRLIYIWNRYPFGKIIVHPRLREDYYNGTPDWEAFRTCVEKCSAPLVYNGDIKSIVDFERFQKAFPEIDEIMIGRGMLANPALARQLQGGAPLGQTELKDFYAELASEYEKILPGEKNVLFCMKELWSYTATLFSNKNAVLKKIQRCKTLGDYRAAVGEVMG